MLEFEVSDAMSHLEIENRFTNRKPFEGFLNPAFIVASETDASFLGQDAKLPDRDR